MEKVLVLGSSGSGKSTFARLLGEKLGIEVVHLDSYYWQPDWKETPRDAWNQILEGLLSKDRWIMDGNYTSSLKLRLGYADTVIFLDFDRFTCLWRCVRRYLTYRGGNRPELASGCNEKIDLDFFKWIWHYQRDIRPRIKSALHNLTSVEVIVLKGIKDVSSYLELIEG